mmetsp:Transcript_11493/g.42050  ORF Transcript_11493/g.42050 Transcript_11493/m.42050 type:complete len:242 (-) Transcript_11493:1265-1990(-)
MHRCSITPSLAGSRNCRGHTYVCNKFTTSTSTLDRGSLFDPHPRTHALEDVILMAALFFLLVLLLSLVFLFFVPVLLPVFVFFLAQKTFQHQQCLFLRCDLLWQVCEFGRFLGLECSFRGLANATAFSSIAASHPGRHHHPTTSPSGSSRNWSIPSGADPRPIPMPGLARNVIVRILQKLVPIALVPPLLHHPQGVVYGTRNRTASRPSSTTVVLLLNLKVGGVQIMSIRLPDHLHTASYL